MNPKHLRRYPGRGNGKHCWVTCWVTSITWPSAARCVACTRILPATGVKADEMHISRHDRGNTFFIGLGHYSSKSNSRVTYPVAWPVPKDRLCKPFLHRTKGWIEAVVTEHRLVGVIDGVVDTRLHMTVRDCYQKHLTSYSYSYELIARELLSSGPMLTQRCTRASSVLRISLGRRSEAHYVPKE